MKKACLLFLAGFTLLGLQSVSLADTVAYWKFNEGTGQDLASVGSAGNMTLQRGTAQSAYADPEWVVKGGRTALQFSNSGTPNFNVLTMKNSGSTSSLVLSEFTVESFINLNSLPPVAFSATSPYTILQLGNFASNQVGMINYGLRVESFMVGEQQMTSLALYYSYVEGGVTKNAGLRHTANLLAGEWYYVGVTRDSDGLISLYVNDDVVTLGASPVPASLTDPLLAIGAAKSSGAGYQRGFDGSISEVRISDVALPVDQLLVNIPEPSHVGIVLVAAVGALALYRRRR